MRPAARITLDGEDVTAKWGQVLSSITVTDEDGMQSDACEIVLDNRSPFPLPPVGAQVRVWLGYEPAPQFMGEFRLQAWEKSGPVRTVTLDCLAADLTSKIRAPRSQSFHEKTVKEICDKIAGDNGLEAIVDQAIGARKIEHIDQQTESDVAFLTRLASRQGATFKLADGRLLFAAKGSRKTPAGTDKPVIKLRPSRVSHWTARHDKRGDYKSASAEYMDTATKKRRSVVAGSGEPRRRDKRLYGSQEEARAAAEAKLAELTRGQLTVEIEMEGDPRLFAEALVRLEGFDEYVDGEYFAKTVTHTLSGAYHTSLSLETEGKGGDSRG